VRKETSSGAARRMNGRPADAEFALGAAVGGSERGAAARAMMLDVAEELLGSRGLNSVSLREIAAAAGQRNNSAVRYHFRDKDGLIVAVIFDRIGKVEARRQALVDHAGDLSAHTAEELLHMLWQPLLDLDGDRKPHRFVRFLLSHQFQFGGQRHPIVADPAHHTASAGLMVALHRHFEHLSLEQFGYRMTLAAVMFWSAVVMHDQAAVAANQVWSTKFSLAETIKLAVAALSAPA
jgi:AcrR family transcriptional regulator